MNALAYTVGHDVVFGASSSPPNTSTGTEMLAHELMHVVQQSSSLGVHAHVLEIAAPEGPLERSADLAGEAVAAGDSAVVEGVVAPLLQRQPEPADWPSIFNLRILQTRPSDTRGCFLPMLCEYCARLRHGSKLIWREV